MSLNISLSKKRVLVTGAGSGIGRALCVKLHSQGTYVYGLCKNKDWLTSLATECPGLKTVCTDLEDWNATRKAVTELGPIDCLVNNAGISIEGTFLETSPENFDKVMNVNVKAMINVSQVIAKGMMDNGISGSIVNVSSLASRCGTRMSIVYNLSKAAVDMLTKSMAVELGPRNIRVNSVNPIIVITPLSKPFFEKGIGATVRDKVVARTPLGRIAELDEVTNTIIFLLSDASPMISGQNLFIDGGYSAA